jgi:mannuronan 5-epimerase
MSHFGDIDHRLPSGRKTGAAHASSEITNADVTGRSGTSRPGACPLRKGHSHPGRTVRLRACFTLLLAPLLWAEGALAAALHYSRDQNLITIENGAVMTLSGLKAALPQAPLTLVDPEHRIWLLSASVLLTNSSTLRLHGRAAGGDVDELRLRSDNTPGPHNFVSITADHGTLDIRATRITSWDTAANAPDTEHQRHGRAFIRARSRMRSMFLIPLQSRMDVVDSEIAFLGYAANESYGLVWKVVAPEPYVFDYVRVHGNVLRSNIHDNYFGLYAAGARGSQWRGNRVHHNVQYGMAPHTRSDDLRIEDNDVHDNGNHGITVRLHCARVIVRNNRVWSNADSGITVHHGSNGGLVADNRVFRNRDAGIVIYDSGGVTVHDNVVRDNARMGIQLAMGASDNRIERNELRGNGFYGLFVGKGRGRPPRGSDGQPRRNYIAHNRIWDSGAENLRTVNAALNTWIGNTLAAPVAASLPAPAPDTAIPPSAQPAAPAP